MNYNDMERLQLFRGLNATDIRKVCDCLGAYTRNYGKGEPVIRFGETQSCFGTVLGGRAHSSKTDLSGKAYTVTVIKEGGYIGALLAGSKRSSIVNITADDRLTVLFIPVGKLVRQCSQNCSAHIKVLSNYIEAISEKALFMHEHIDCLNKPTSREKILTYLLGKAGRAGGGYVNSNIEIEFDRNGMAKHLNIERSSLSRELSNMKKDGLIDYYKNMFRLLK